MCGGWACFVAALFMIGIVTAIVGEIAGLMGCVIGMKPGVTAITFVAIGTSLPDTFASKKAAQDDRYADSAVGNITGSNSVNVFLGLGLPWVIASIYYKN
jgi:solute carrier family 8 (sodium/calcium exchanger)